MKLSVTLLIAAALLAGVWLIFRAQTGHESPAYMQITEPAEETQPESQSASNSNLLSAPTVPRLSNPSPESDVPSSTGSPAGSRSGRPTLEEIISKDVVDGINAEARAKEARLRQAAAQLSPGITGQQVLQVLGQPDTAKVLVTNGWEQRWVAVPTNTVLATAPGLRLGYWPRVGVPFNGKNGQGYQVLYVWLDQQAKVAAWRWARPSVLGAGSLSSIRAQDDYWRGVHELSGPPPVELPPDMPQGAQ